MMNLFQTLVLPSARPPAGRQLPSAANPQPQPAVARRYRLWVLLLPLLLYAAALNPFFLPGTYDNIVYHFGGVSLAQEGSFSFLGKHVVDWPPGVSALLAVPFFFGLQSVWTAKICILLCAAVGLILALRLFEKEERPFPLLTLVLFALLPLSFLMGTRTMSEWPYFLSSILFLHAFGKLRDGQRGLRPVLTAGVLLGIASLTKFTGVLLGTAVIAQMVERFCGPSETPSQAEPSAHQSLTFWSALFDRVRAIQPELITALIGAGLFLLWKAKINWQIHSGTATEYVYYRSGLVPLSLGGFAPLSVPGHITNLFFHSEVGMSLFGWEGWTRRLVCAVPAVLVLFGMLLRLSSRARRPSDWYVLSLLVLFSSVAENQQTRYLLPVAPFLIGYGLFGYQRIGQWLRIREGWHQFRFGRAVVAIWLVALVSFALHLLLVGNLSRTHRGLCYLVSRTPETFYQGFWLDLYRTCQRVKQDPTPGKLAVIGDDDKYVTAFSGRQLVSFNPGEDFAFVLVLNGTEISAEQSRLWNLRCLDRHESIILYKREDPLL